MAKNRQKNGENTQKTAESPAGPWRNRIVRYGEAAPADLVANVKNWRTHPEAQHEALADALGKVGIVQNIVVNERSGKMLDGHLRVEMALDSGQPSIPITYVDLSDEEENLILATIDPVTGLAGTDQKLLDSLIADIKLSDLGMDLGDGLNDLLESLSPSSYAEAEGADDVPDVPETPVSRLGDVWMLGRHRILCADATCLEDVARLLDGKQADLVFSDPPFNVAVHGYTKEKLTIMNDDMTPGQFKEFLGKTFLSYRQALKDGGSMYICHSSSWQREFQNAMEGAGFEVRCQVIWAKNTFAWGFGRYKFRHEPIFYAHVAGQKDAWYGDKSQSTLWEERKPAANRLHPTMKPVELIDRALLNSSKTDDLVLDLFGGSGSTLISCEKNGRRAFLMELDPRYVDVIICRWQAFTEKTAILDGDGRTFAEIKAARAAVSDLVPDESPVAV